MLFDPAGFFWFWSLHPVDILPEGNTSEPTVTCPEAQQRPSAGGVQSSVQGGSCVPSSVNVPVVPVLKAARIDATQVPSDEVALTLEARAKKTTDRVASVLMSGALSREVNQKPD